MRQPAVHTWLKIALSMAAVGCGGASAGTDPSAGPGAAPVAPDKGSAADAGPAAVPADAAAPPRVDAGAPPPVGPDGAPTREACTSSYGTGLSTSFGRLDGALVAIVPPGHHGCNGDADHLHLQVKAAGAVYDIAVTMASTMGGAMPEVFLAEKDAPLANGPWADGWHAGTRFDYVNDLGLHAADFTAMPAAALAMKVQQALGTVNHISVYATGYGPSGGHKVHRNSGGQDGALVLDPTSATPHVLAFHFSTQSF